MKSRVDPVRKAGCKARNRPKHFMLIAPLLLLLALAVEAADPVVSHVRAKQRSGSKLVDIYYDVKDPDSEKLNVTVQVSVNGGASYDLPASTFYGSGYGPNVTPGRNKLITWDAGADWDGQSSANVRFRVTASDSTAPGGFVLIPGGPFQMGDSFSEGSSYERPVHTVSVSAFYMERTEVTNDQMVEVMQWAYERGKISASSSTVRNREGSSQELLDLDDSDCRITWNGSEFRMKSAKGSTYPCVEVTWYGAVAFCNYRSQMEGLTPCYNLSDWSCNWNANGYRLPTEAEWEKAARGGASGRRFPWGNTIDHSRANYEANGSRYSYDVSPYTDWTYHPDYDSGGWPYTSPVGSFPSAGSYGAGLYDMAGNVWEWCWDRWDSDWYSKSGATEANTRGPSSGSDRVGRGGSWGGHAFYCRAAGRDDGLPDYSYYYLGFRCVRQ